MKKILKKLINIFTCLMVVVAILIMLFTMISVMFFDKTDRNILGYKAFIVLSDSMSKTDFDAGDLVLVKEEDDYSSLKEGDIIAYISQNEESYGEVITHKIRSITTDNNGQVGFITYGTTTDTNDETIVTYPYIIGKYKTSIPKVGLFFNFLKTTKGYITCILIPFLILILLEVINAINLYSKYRKQQRRELEKERLKIKRQEEKSKAMEKELIELRNKLKETGQLS